MKSFLGKIVPCLAAFSLFLSTNFSMAAEKSVPDAKKSLSVTGKVVSKNKNGTGSPENDLGVFYRFKLNTFLGMMVIRQPGLAGGEQFGFAPLNGIPFYLGPAIDFSLFSPGFLFSVLGGGWYELHVFGSPKLSIALGALGGVGVTSGLADIPERAGEVFFEAGIVQDIDDLWSLRGEVRPGIVGGAFAFLVNFNVSFRFY